MRRLEVVVDEQRTAEAVLDAPAAHVVQKPAHAEDAFGPRGPVVPYNGRWIVPYTRRRPARRRAPRHQRRACGGWMDGCERRAFWRASAIADPQPMPKLISRFYSAASLPHPPSHLRSRQPPRGPLHQTTAPRCTLAPQAGTRPPPPPAQCAAPARRAPAAPPPHRAAQRCHQPPPRAPPAVHAARQTAARRAPRLPSRAPRRAPSLNSPTRTRPPCAVCHRSAASHL